MKKNVVYLWQCIKCKEFLKSEDTTLKHCGKLVQWAGGIDGKGIGEIDMNNPMVKINVSGYIEMNQENFDTIMTHDDPYMSLIYSVHMGYCDSSHLEFTTEE